MCGGIDITAHARRRWQERVDQRATLTDAGRALRRLIETGKVRPRPRHWMSTTACEPGLTFVYNARYPGACVVVRDTTAVTVLTRSLVRRSPRRAGGPGDGVSSRARHRCVQDRGRWQRQAAVVGELDG